MAKRPKAKDLTVARMDPSDKRVIGQQVVARILELIRTGSLRAGDRLLPSVSLSRFSASAGQVSAKRVQALSMLGVINSLHGGGAYVSDLGARTLLAPLDFYLSLTKANLPTPSIVGGSSKLKLREERRQGRRPRISTISASSSRRIRPFRTIPSDFAFSTPASTKSCPR